MLILSLLITLVSSLIGLTALRWITRSANNEGRKNIYLFVTNVLESAPYAESLKMIELFRAESPSLASSIWVISADGHVYATNTTQPLPPAWKTIPLPRQPHELTAKKGMLGLFAQITIVKLRAPQPTFLVVQPSETRPLKTAVYLQITIFVLGLFGTASGGLGMTFLYLRRTSLEAKDVISRMHSGDLRARFNIRKLDEIGSLKLDFNAMADEIERLLLRVRKTETARKNLLRELGHDLRTPLTSLRTSVETLMSYREHMSDAQQLEFMTVIQSELNYFVRLLEDLFFIADIAEPASAKAWDAIDLAALIRAELQSRQLMQPHLRWHYDDTGATATCVAGDGHLLQRLLRNVFDNASRYARSTITVSLENRGRALILTIADDGEGMSRAAIANFGTRRKHRVQSGVDNANLSLGLGSVIIKTVVELHRGELCIESGALDPGQPPGTRFVIAFPDPGTAHA